MNIAIIPARSGSKRISNKNIKLFKGVPIIAYAIQKAIHSQIFENVIVSTDSEEIASIANYYGAKTPFMRPSALSNDFVGLAEVMEHASVKTSKIYGHSIENLCCILPTSPLIGVESIVAGLKVLQGNQYDYVFTGLEFESPIERSMKKIKNGGVQLIAPEYAKVRTQDIEKRYYDAGQFYWGTIKAWTNQEPIFSDKSFLLELNKWEAQDIDTEADWRMAEILYDVQLIMRAP